MPKKISEQDRIDWHHVVALLDGRSCPEHGPNSASIPAEGYWYSLRINELQTHATLHGLACMRCNGTIRYNVTTEMWDWNLNHAAGAQMTHPKAIIAMVQRHNSDKETTDAEA